MELVWAVFVVKPDDAEAEFPARVGRFARRARAGGAHPAPSGATGSPASPRCLWSPNGAGCCSRPIRSGSGPVWPRGPRRRLASSRWHQRPPRTRPASGPAWPVCTMTPTCAGAGWSCCGMPGRPIEGRWRAEGQERGRSAGVGSAGQGARGRVLRRPGSAGGGLRLRRPAAALVSRRAPLAGLPVVLAPAWLGRKGFLVALTGLLLYGPPNTARPGRSERRDPRSGPPAQGARRPDPAGHLRGHRPPSPHGW